MILIQYALSFKGGSFSLIWHWFWIPNFKCIISFDKLGELYLKSSVPENIKNYFTYGTRFYCKKNVQAVYFKEFILIA